MQDTTTNDLHKIIANIRANLRKNYIEAEIDYRLKDPYSALKKMLRKGITVKELTDLIGFRIIVNKQYECYKLLTILYNIYPVNMAKSKDYIANPKDNGYRSLHIVVIADIVNSGEFGARSDGATPISNRRALSDDVTNFSSIDYTYDCNIEIQIRTNRMHNIAESGTANHKEYKKTQEEKLKKLLYEEKLNIAAINTEINKAYDIFNQFNWTISELVAYEQIIENLWHKLKNNF